MANHEQKVCRHPCQVIRGIPASATAGSNQERVSNRSCFAPVRTSWGKMRSVRFLP